MGGDKENHHGRGGSWMSFKEKDNKEEKGVTRKEMRIKIIWLFFKMMVSCDYKITL